MIFEADEESGMEDIVFYVDLFREKTGFSIFFMMNTPIFREG